ncbi:uncharacterized protein LOC113133586 [Mastacembelus armatus]|uniref:uncharacterized protein LOC113133586 n=1 Tax=Mastacembelus armatus TaxID=205130 RepID=UPI000E457494|nr:uncharacterized protein LOC113133586 [Mastacembelus armatus]
MVDRDVALEGLSALCNATVTSVQQRTSRGVHYIKPEQLNTKTFVHSVLVGEASCPVSGTIFHSINTGVRPGCLFKLDLDTDGSKTGKIYIIDEEEFFDPKYHYDFTNVTDSQTFYRGGEKYERPCGWQRFAIKVLDQYGENTWLGNTNRSTQSVAGEWPVSYHGTSQGGAEGIIKRRYEPGPGAVYGYGVYSTPDLSVANGYAKSFTSQKTGKTYKVILQNRINPEHREKCNHDKYWLVPVKAGASDKEQQELVERAIRPYGLLLKEETNECIIL